MIPLTQLAHDIVTQVLRAGDTAIDATVGNGHDTVFLAQIVGPSGSVYGFDVQAAAIERTQTRLDELGLSNTILLNCGHELMLNELRSEVRGTVSAIMFNLGYLPGGDKTLTTRTDTTLPALQQAMVLIPPSGVITILAYPGHPEGAEETVSINGFLSNLPKSHYQVEQFLSDSDNSLAPQLFVIRNLGRH